MVSLARPSCLLVLCEQTNILKWLTAVLSYGFCSEWEEWNAQPVSCFQEGAWGGGLSARKGGD